ncbi:MAG: cytochrome c biogenesis CcdA family protein [Gaiellales bacterium]
MTQAVAAFLAGLVSFATPCVLPLVPAYLSAIGVRADDSRSAVRAGVPFVLGFSAVFVLLGAGAAVVGTSLADHRLQLVHLAGIVIVAMGFVTMGLLRIPALERSLVPAVEPARGTGSPLLLGGAFGLCWTPCVGPVLAGLLALASSSRTVASGAALLAVYSLGLALPFLAAAAALGRVMSVAQIVRDRYDLVRVVCGALLVAAGLAVFFDRMYMVNAWVDHVSRAV